MAPCTQELEPPAIPERFNETGSLTVAAFTEEQTGFAECMFTELFVNLEDASADAGKQKWCRSSDGAWQPVTT